MRLIWSLVGLWVTIAVSQKTTQNATEQARVAGLLSEMPQCALTCLVQALNTTACAPTDYACTCDDNTYNDEVTACVRVGCTVKQQLITKNHTELICNREPPTSQPPVNEVGMGVALLAYILRIISKLSFPCDTNRPQTLWWDDAVMTVAMFFLILPVGAMGVILVECGLGKSVWTVSFENITKIQHIYYFEEDLYLSALPAVRVSMLLTYLRIFAGKRFRHIAYALMALNVAYAIAFVLISVFQCDPIPYAWYRWDGEHEGRCNNINAQSWAAAGINILLDIGTLTLPLPQLWQMKLNKRKKFLVMIMFSVGFFATMVSIIRLQKLLQFGTNDNFTYHYAAIGYWSVLELDLAVLCACMPAIRNLIRRFLPKMMGVSTVDMDDTHQSRMTGLSGRTAVSSGIAKMEPDVFVRTRDDDEGHFIPLENIESGHNQDHVQNFSRPSPGALREPEMYIDQNGRIHAREPVSPI